MKNHLINKVKFRSPKNQKEFDEYDFFRWKVLREPLGKKIETLKDKFDKDSFHIMGLYNKVIIASGRVHFNNDNEAQIRYMAVDEAFSCLLYTSPSPRDAHESRMPSSA